MTTVDEPLLSVIYERTSHELGSDLAASFLSILADRGVITHREMVEVAKRIATTHDLAEILGKLTDDFARHVGLPPFPEQEPDVPPGLTSADMLWIDPPDYGEDPDA